MSSCYAIGANKPLIYAALRARFCMSKVFIPVPSKSPFYCVTKAKQRRVKTWQYSELRKTRAIP